jgi:hypothetical protein
MHALLFLSLHLTCMHTILTGAAVPPVQFTAGRKLAAFFHIFYSFIHLRNKGNISNSKILSNWRIQCTWACGPAQRGRGSLSAPPCGCEAMYGRNSYTSIHHRACDGKTFITSSVCSACMGRGRKCGPMLQTDVGLRNFTYYV